MKTVSHGGLNGDRLSIISFGCGCPMDMDQPQLSYAAEKPLFAI
jgi:hypothetical protein